MSTWTLKWPTTYPSWTNVDIWLTTYPPPFVHMVFEWPLTHIWMYPFHTWTEINLIFILHFQDDVMVVTFLPQILLWCPFWAEKNTCKPLGWQHMLGQFHHPNAVFSCYYFWLLSQEIWLFFCFKFETRLNMLFSPTLLAKTTLEGMLKIEILNTKNVTAEHIIMPSNANAKQW